jgi:F-type H+-transporting ATPase subunit delta
MRSTEISLRETYTQVLFELACNNHVADAVKDDLEFLSETTKKEEDFILFLDSPYFTFPSKEQFASRVLSGRITELTMNFLMVIIKHNRTDLLPEIISRYEQLWDAKNGYLPVKITVSHPLNHDEMKELQASLDSAAEAITRLEVEVKPDIIGGITIRCGDRVIDNTILGKLQTMMKTIMGQLKSRSSWRSAEPAPGK